MNEVAFAPMIDFPLIAITWAGFIAHFHNWAYRPDIETSIDLPGRLPAARLRITLLLGFLLLLCWSLNLAVWSIFVLVLGIELAAVLITGAVFHFVGHGPGFSACFIREWAFGFPQMILRPPSHNSNSPRRHELTDAPDALVGQIGVTTSSLRPMGEANFDGAKQTVVSFDGGWLDVGTKIIVTTYRNGFPCVTPTDDRVAQTSPGMSG